jgi:predicted SprT family Zn-dependent metalloprotease
MDILKQVEKLANELLNKDYSVINNSFVVNPAKLGYKFGFDRSKRRFGRCNFTKKLITVSKPLCLANPNQLHKKIKDTILHEIAHAICIKIYGLELGRGHGHRWQQIAKEIGCNGKPKYSYRDFGGIKKPQSKYTLVCKNCGKEYPKHRKPKRKLSCGSCYPHGFNPNFLMELRQNY